MVEVLSFKVTLPLFPPPVRPDPAATPVMVPAPGNVWPGAKVRIPLLLTLTPVSAGTAAPAPNNRFKVPEGAAVLLAAGSAFH